MTLIEALTLAKKKPGVRVRPVVWRGHYLVYEYRFPDKTIGHFWKYKSDSHESCGEAHLCTDEELFGEWEVEE